MQTSLRLQVSVCKRISILASLIISAIYVRLLVVFDTTERALKRMILKGGYIDEAIVVGLGEAVIRFHEVFMRLLSRKARGNPMTTLMYLWFVSMTDECEFSVV